MTKRLFRAVMFIGIALVAWEVGARSSPFITVLISRPSRTLTFMMSNFAALMNDLLHTLGIAVLGLAGGVIVGIGIGFLTFLYPRFQRTVQALATVTQAIPLIVFAPFLVIAFGVGVLSKAILAAVMATFPILLGFINSAQQTEGDYSEFATFYDLTPSKALISIYFPLMFPSLVGQVRIAASLALLGTVIAEFTGAVVGLGRNIFLGTIRVDPELLMSSLILTAALGLSIHGLMSWAERKASWWNR